MRNVDDALWDTRLFDRTYAKDSRPPPLEADETILRKADHPWRAIVAAQPPVEIDAAFAREVERIVDAARKELMP